MTTDDEEEFNSVLQELSAMWVKATGSVVVHPHLVALLDPQLRRSTTTTNYLAASASGTLSDRWFSPENNDELPQESVEEFNRLYQERLARARDLAIRLCLPATAGLQP